MGEEKNLRLLKSKASGPRCRRVCEGRKKLSYDESYPVSQAKEVLKPDIDSRAKKVPYTLVEFWTDLKMIWNFIFECFREKDYQRQNILRERQIWIKKCNDIMKQWREESTKRKAMLVDQSSISIAPERNDQRKGEQRVARHFVLRYGYDYTLEVGPSIPSNLTGDPNKEEGTKTSEFRHLPPTFGQIEGIPKTTCGWQKIVKKRKTSQSLKEVAELTRCSLCLATGGQLARCGGCRRIR